MQKIQYLKRLTECPFENVIGVNLTDTFLSELLQILDKHCVDENLPVLHILKGVCKNDEMTILPLMFSAEDKKGEFLMILLLFECIGYVFFGYMSLISRGTNF